MNELTERAIRKRFRQLCTEVVTRETVRNRMDGYLTALNDFEKITFEELATAKHNLTVWSTTSRFKKVERKNE